MEFDSSLCLQEPAERDEVTPSIILHFVCILFNGEAQQLPRITMTVSTAW
jgi:hypothetical protein